MPPPGTFFAFATGSPLENSAISVSPTSQGRAKTGSHARPHTPLYGSVLRTGRWCRVVKWERGSGSELGSGVPHIQVLLLGAASPPPRVSVLMCSEDVVYLPGRCCEDGKM